MAKSVGLSREDMDHPNLHEHINNQLFGDGTSTLVADKGHSNEPPSFGQRVVDEIKDPDTYTQVLFPGPLGVPIQEGIKALGQSTRRHVGNPSESTQGAKAHAVGDGLRANNRLNRGIAQSIGNADFVGYSPQGKLPVDDALGEQERISTDEF